MALHGKQLGAGDSSGETQAYARRVSIRPIQGWHFLEWREIWAHRELLWVFAWREIKVRYKQTLLGIVWAMLQPFLTMIVFSVVFGHFGKIPSDGVPYPLFTFAALLAWQVFAFGLTQSSSSLVANQQLLTKIYFPRIIIPIAAVLPGFLDFAFASLVFIGLMVYYGVVPTMTIVMLPVFVLLAAIAALSIGLWLSAINVRYRDVRHLLPFLTQLWFYGTPIAYSTSIVPERWHLLFGLNPMVGVVDGFRWALLGAGPFPFRLLLLSLLVTGGLLLGGLVYFTHSEGSFADTV